MDAKAIDRRYVLLAAGMSMASPFLTAAAGTADFRGEWPRPREAQPPFPHSETFRSLYFTGRHREYTNADTWYPSWAADGHLYSPWTDGYLPDSNQYLPFSESYPGYPCNSLDYRGRKAATAQARIEGDDPLKLNVVNLPPRVEASPRPYGGRYPCGSLVHNGNWYYGTYCLTNGGDCGGVGWTELGPFVGFRHSTDGGKTWRETPHSPDQPLFPENPKVAKVKFGSPHFVDFGRNMEHSPDGYAYLLAHGSQDASSCNSWIQGDAVYMARVRPSPGAMNDLSAYEFFAGGATWSKRFSDAAPALTWKGGLGCVTATYNRPLRRYLMCVTRGVGKGHHDTCLLESAALTGPWRLVKYLERFGPEAYFVNIPSKFIGDGGRSFWLCYSANWSDKLAEGNPPGSRYALCLREVRLKA